MASNDMLPCVITNPVQGEAQASIIWMHGLGADGHDFASLVPVLGLDQVRFIFPHAPFRPISINGGQSSRGWYDIYSLERMSQEDRAGVEASMASISDLIARELASGIPSDRIVLAGFSQGGAMALYTGLTYDKPLAGILALSCYLPLAAQCVQHATPSNKSTPIFQAHGDFDPVLPLALGRSSYDLLSKLQYPISWHHYPMAHAVCDDEVADIRQWLQERLSV